TNKDKGKQGSYRSKINNKLHIQKESWYRYQHSSYQRREPGRSIFCMNLSKYFRQKAITAHHHPNPGLSHLKSQQGATNGNYSTHRNHSSHPFNSNFLKNERQG